MTQKERIVAQIKHQETDFVPYTLDFVEDFDGPVKDGALERVNSYYGSTSWRGKLHNHIVRVPTVKHDVGSGSFGNESKAIDAYGTQWCVDKIPRHIEKPALDKPTLAGYKFPDADTLFRSGWYESSVQSIEKNKDYFTVTSLGMGLFERSWAIRGLEDVLADMILHPDFCQELVKRVFEHQMMILDRVLALPIDGFMFLDDWGYQHGVLVGAERWRKYFKPYIAKMYAKVHEAGKYTLQHTCGSVEEILPDLIEAGLDVYESVQPEARNNSPYKLKKLYGEDITFWGGLGSQSTIPFGNPSEIKSEVNKLCEEIGKGGGYILAPAKPIRPETSTENAVAIVEAFAEEAGVRALTEKT